MADLQNRLVDANITWHVSDRINGSRR